MEVKNEFKVRVEGENVIVDHTVTRVMTKEESIKECQGLNGQIQQVEQTKVKLEKGIEEKAAETQLNTIKEQLGDLTDFKSTWDEMNKPFYEELKTKIKKEIRQEKLKRGYARVKEDNKKTLLKNQILGPLMHKHNVEMTHPMVKGLKEEFDEI